MKISYIIAPFRSSEYLVRCINSILRQTGGDNEIIIAENDLELTAEESEHIFSECHVKKISDQADTDHEKLIEAVKMASGNALIKLIDVDTVAVPIASAKAADSSADIIFTSLAVKNGDDYTVVNIDDSAKTGDLLIKSAFIRKEIFEGIISDIYADSISFELRLDNAIASGAEYASTDDICFYVQNINDNKSSDLAQMYIKYKPELKAIFENSLNSGRKAKLELFDKYISKLYKIMCSEQYDDTAKEAIFTIIKDAARLIGDNEFAQRLFLLYFGASPEAIADMDLQAYLFFSKRVLTLSDKALVTAQLEQIVEDTTKPINNSLSVLSQIKRKQEEESAKAKALAEEVSKLKNDISALTKNMHFVFKSASAGGETEAYEEPLQEIPAMFAQGKLGFKVIVKSFKAWLKYKFKRKK